MLKGVEKTGNNFTSTAFLSRMSSSGVQGATGARAPISVKQNFLTSPSWKECNVGTNRGSEGSGRTVEGRKTKDMASGGFRETLESENWGERKADVSKRGEANR